MMHRRAFALLALAATFAISACGKKAPELAPAPTPSSGGGNSGRTDSPSGGDRNTSDRDADRERREAAMRALTSPILFGFDQSDLTTESRSSLDAKLEVLRSTPAMRVRIEGHADESGSDEYNLALGQRRAAAARRYLVDHGIEGSRLEIISFGEQQPKCGDASDSCYAQNRRDEFRVTAGSPVMEAGSL
jgi:peptidoglycan-associated lipoprotein